MIRTKRLILRQWKPKDYPLFAKMNADPLVREFFPTLLTTDESNEQACLFQKRIEENGWGFFAVEAPGIADFIGFIGIQPIPFTAPFTPSVEIGWRIAHEFWGRGFAPEGASAVLEYGFRNLHLPEIVSLTPLQNLRSMKVMEKIGMTRNPEEDFDHPRVADGHPLKRHVLYRITNNEWEIKYGKQ